MRALICYPFYISLLLGPLPARAEFDIQGIRLADHYRLGGRSLTLNGAGIRSKLFVKIYVGALYLDKTTHEARQALQSTGPKSMQMVMLYKKVGADKIRQGWSDGFQANLSPTASATLKTRLEQFNDLFPALRRGDHVYMDFVPGQGTTVKINDQVRGQIAGDDFFTALLSVWIGEHPADGQLKDGLMSD